MTSDLFWRVHDYVWRLIFFFFVEFLGLTKKIQYPLVADEVLETQDELQAGLRHLMKKTLKSTFKGNFSIGPILGLPMV